jgi:hypothetical protein
MAIETRIRQLGESVARAAGSLVWFYRTRPEARRHLVAPAFGVLLSLWLSLAWAAPLGLLLAFVLLASFVLFAAPLVEELRSLEAHADAGSVFNPGDSPLLARLAEAHEPAQTTEPERSVLADLDLVKRYAARRQAQRL